MLHLLIALAMAAPCDHNETPEDWARRLAAIQEPVALGLDEVEATLDTLVQAAACASAPVERADLARLWMARGATFVLRGGSPEDARRALGAAKALGGEAAWDPAYGPVVRRAFQAAPIAPEGTLWVRLPHDVLVVDGLIDYSEDALSVPAGSHLVQWSVDGVWTGAWIEVSAGCETAFGVPSAPPPTPAALPVLPSLGGLELRLEGGMGYVAAQSRVYMPPLPASATTLYTGGPLRTDGASDAALLRVPTGGAVGHGRVELAWRAAWLSANGAFAPTPPTHARWPAPTATTFLLGAHAAGSWWSLAGGAGLRISGAPRARPPGDWVVRMGDLHLPAYETWISPGPAVGGQLRLGGPVGFAMDGELWVGPVTSGSELRLGPTARYGALEPALAVRVGGQGVTRAESSPNQGYTDRHIWLGAEATLAVRL